MREIESSIPAAFQHAERLPFGFVQIAIPPPIPVAVQFSRPWSTKPSRTTRSPRRTRVECYVGPNNREAAGMKARNRSESETRKADSTAPRLGLSFAARLRCILPSRSAARGSQNVRPPANANRLASRSSCRCSGVRAAAESPPVSAATACRESSCPRAPGLGLASLPGQRRGPRPASTRRPDRASPG